MSVVVDASVLVAATIDSGADGLWAEGIVSEGELVAPHLAPWRSLKPSRCPSPRWIGGSPGRPGRPVGS